MSFTRGVEEVVVDNRIFNERSMVTQQACSLPTRRFNKLLSDNFVAILNPGTGVFIFILLPIVHRIVIEAGCPADQIIASRQV